MNDEKRTVEEAYVSATTTSDMRVVPDHTVQGDAETIIAAGLSKSVAGACFIRLHGEWSSAEKPRVQSQEQIKKLADSLTFDQLAEMRLKLKIHAMANMKPSAALSETAARAAARAWYIAEVEMLLGKLKSFRAAIGFMVANMEEWDNRPEPVLRQVCTEVLIWWLDKVCPRCNGTKYQTVSGTNRHSNRLCPAPDHGGCGGTGTARIPRSEDGKRLANHIDDCCYAARTSIKNRLRRR